MISALIRRNGGRYDAVLLGATFMDTATLRRRLRPWWRVWG